MQPLQVAEDLAAHVEHDALAGHLHQVGLGEAHHEGGEQGQQVEPRHAVSPGASPRAMCRSIATLVR